LEKLDKEAQKLYSYGDDYEFEDACTESDA
jgi:hypothetical protein